MVWSNFDLKLASNHHVDWNNWKIFNIPSKMMNGAPRSQLKDWCNKHESEYMFYAGVGVYCFESEKDYLLCMLRWA